MISYLRQEVERNDVKVRVASTVATFNLVSWVGVGVGEGRSHPRGRRRDLSTPGQPLSAWLGPGVGGQGTATTAWLLLGWVTVELSCPYKQPACPAIGVGSELTDTAVPVIWYRQTDRQTSSVCLKYYRMLGIGQCERLVKNQNVVVEKSVLQRNESASFNVFPSSVLGGVRACSVAIYTQTRRL
ncbi:hypothetical protein J6590_066149 [Homalodisca vitripennis]|nr:hypothetical protein J6590_066149 [Homalodisca vitripennis]